MLNEITRQAYELKFCKKVFSMMLRPDEIARIRSKSNFDEAEDDWKVPAFIFKQKELIFPKLNGMALVGDERTAATPLRSKRQQAHACAELLA